MEVEPLSGFGMMGFRVPRVAAEAATLGWFIASFQDWSHLGRRNLEDEDEEENEDEDDWEPTRGPEVES